MSGDIFADEERHTVRDRPLADVKLLGVAGRFGIGRIITIPPDFPQALADIGIGQCPFDPFGGQVEVILHRPPHADVVIFVVIVTKLRFHAACMCIAHEDSDIVIQIGDARRIAQETRIGI